MVDAEMQTNYLSPIHTVAHFLPHLTSLGASSTPAGIVLVSSGLGVVPMSRCGNYCASKAALHSFILSLREQLKFDKNTPNDKISIIELVTPLVQSECLPRRRTALRVHSSTSP